MRYHSQCIDIVVSGLFVIIADPAVGVKNATKNTAPNMTDADVGMPGIALMRAKAAAVILRTKARKESSKFRIT